MFNKKPRRNFRQRKNSSSDEEDRQKPSGEAEETDKAAPELVNKPLKPVQGRGISCSSKREETPLKPDSSEEDDPVGVEMTEERKKDDTKKKAKSMLSFSEDREGESTFKLKKSSDKAVLFQVRKKKKKETLDAKSSYNKASVDGALSSKSPRQDDGSEVSPSSENHDDYDDDKQHNYRDNDGDDNSDDGSDEGKDVDTNSSDASSMSPFSSSNSNSNHAPAKKVVIPKTADIEAARRRRRAARAQKDFISLGRDGRSSAGSTPDHHSRVDEEERIDDDDDEPDDHERRIAFAPGLKSVRERIAEKLGESDESLSGTDAEEQELWEETQIGKGVKRRPGDLSPSGSESSNYSSSGINKGRQKKKSSATRIPKTLPEITVSMVKRRITGKLDSLKEVHRARQAELRRMENDVDSAKTSLETLEEHSSENQLKFYRSMTIYVHNLVECLREKMVEINSLELELQTLLSDQMEALLAQRQEKIQEQAERLQQVSYNSDEQSGSNRAETQCKGALNAKTEEDFISEDTQPSTEEEEQLQKKIDDILSRSQVVFSDVQDDFSNVKKILSRFEEWRSSYSDSYHSAYISLCLPKLLAPIIRHQLLTWNPLKDTSGDFENLPWFAGVETFCHGHGHEELEQTDRETLSNVIERTVLPKITAFVEMVWDPLSSQQTSCLTTICHKLKEDYSIFEGERSKPVKALMEAVVCRLRSCVDEEIFIPLYPKKILEDKSSPQLLFRDQQFWTAVKLLGNMGKWDSLLLQSVLQELMLDKLLSRYLMITLCSQTISSNAIDACRKVADSLPISWFKGETVCLPQLQNFRNYIVERVHTICKTEPPEDTKTRSAVVEALKVLSRIRCHDAIMTLANKYHYEDAIYSHQLLNQDAE